MMTTLNNCDSMVKRVKRSLAGYLVHRQGPQAFSARDAIAHIRTANPEVKCSDRRLTDTMAGVAVIADMDIALDVGSRAFIYNKGANHPGCAVPQ
jgi:hypothetical protein